MAQGNGCTARSARTFLPAAILKRTKRGFAVNVVDDWFRGASATERWKRFCWMSGSDISIPSSSRREANFEEHRSGQKDNHKILFSLVVFEEWLRAHEEPIAALS